MEKLNLTKEQIKEIKYLHKKSSSKKLAYYLNALILMDKGFTYAQIEEILLLNERSLKRLKKSYLEGGADSVLEDHYHGGYFKLSEEQIIKAIKQHVGERKIMPIPINNLAVSSN